MVDLDVWLDDPWRDATVVVGSPLRSTPGVLPPATGAVVAGIDLGEGLVPDPQFGPPREPPLWLSLNPLDGLMWERLVSAFPETGLWPMVLDSLDFDQPWRGGEFGFTAAGEPAIPIDALVVFEQWSPGTVLTLASGSSGPAPPELSIPRTGGILTTLGLVPVQRPADVTLVLGWGGDGNYDRLPADNASVFRSWEDRFGAYVIRLGLADVGLWVDRPPTEPEQARLLALEHFAWCPTLGEHGVDFDRYATNLIGAESWSCWWD